MADPANPKLRHFTMRRGFVTFVGFSILTLYLVWAGYGAAPTSLSFLTEAPEEEPDSMADGMVPEEFREITEKFAEDLSLPDGSVRPTRQWTRQLGLHGAEEEGQDEAIEPGEATRMASAAETTAAVDREREEGHGHGEGGGPVDVFLMAERFSYTPNVLRLDHGVPYRFHMMSMDVNHGASINTGSAGHIMRRPARALVTMVMTFPEPGEFTVYCTVYCGLGHGQMKGKIIVE